MARPRYETNDPTGYMGDPRRGAALGRSDVRGQYDGSRLTLRRVRIDCGGYDRLGTYWGLGRPLFWAADDSGQVEMIVRGDDRSDAKRLVSARYPNARFWR